MLSEVRAGEWQWAGGGKDSLCVYIHVVFFESVQCYMLVCICMQVCMCVHMYIYVYVCIYRWVCLCTYMHAHLCTHAWMHTQSSGSENQCIEKVQDNTETKLIIKTINNKSTASATGTNAQKQQASPLRPGSGVPLWMGQEAFSCWIIRQSRGISFGDKLEEIRKSIGPQEAVPVYQMVQGTLHKWPDTALKSKPSATQSQSRLLVISCSSPVPFHQYDSYWSPNQLIFFPTALKRRFSPRY